MIDARLLTTRTKNILLILIISLIVNSIGYFMATSTITDERKYIEEAYLLQRDGSFPRIYPLLPILSFISLVFLGVTKQGFLLIPMFASTLTAVLIYLFSLNLYNDNKRATLSALVVVSNPLMVWLSSKHMTETLFTLMLVATFYFITRKDLSPKHALLAGLFSTLAYLTKYPGLLLISFMILSLAWIKRIKLLLAFLIPTSFLALYWAYNTLLFGTPFPSEEYSLSFVQRLSEYKSDTTHRYGLQDYTWSCFTPSLSDPNSDPSHQEPNAEVIIFNAFWPSLCQKADSHLHSMVYSTSATMY